MKRSSVSLLRSVAYGGTRSRAVAVSGSSASYKTLAPSSTPSPIPPRSSSDPTFSLRDPLHNRSFSYYSLQDNEMEEEWKRICKEYTEGEEEVIVDPPNLVTVESAEDFKIFLNKVKDESIPAIFYYTSLSSAPCRAVLPMVRELSKRNPRIIAYKIDKDEEAVKSTLEEFNVSAVPHINFFLRGKKVGEVIGPDTKDLMETLQKLVNYYMGMQQVVSKDYGEPIPVYKYEPAPEYRDEPAPEYVEEHDTDSGSTVEEAAPGPTGESGKI